jgi:hypothetical protein
MLLLKYRKEAILYLIRRKTDRYSKQLKHERLIIDQTK